MIQSLKGFAQKVKAAVGNFFRRIVEIEKKTVAASKTVVVSLISGGVTALYNQYQTTGTVDLTPAGLQKMKNAFIAGMVVAAIAYLMSSPLGGKKPQ